jgi:hypothetical protein
MTPSKPRRHIILSVKACTALGLSECASVIRGTFAGRVSTDGSGTRIDGQFSGPCHSPCRRIEKEPPSPNRHVIFASRNPARSMSLTRINGVRPKRPICHLEPWELWFVPPGQGFSLAHWLFATTQRIDAVGRGRRTGGSAGWRVRWLKAKVGFRTPVSISPVCGVVRNPRAEKPCYNEVRSYAGVAKEAPCRHC